MNKAKYDAQATRNEALLALKIAFKKERRKVKVKAVGVAVCDETYTQDNASLQIKEDGDIPVRVTYDGLPCVRRYRIVG